MSENLTAKFAARPSMTATMGEGVPVPGPAGASLGIQDEGIAVPAQPALNFTGAGVSVADDPANSRTNVIIAGGVGGVSSMTVAAFDAATGNGTTQGGLGAVFLSDGLYQCLWNGTAWEYYHAGQRVYRPVNGEFSWLNQSTSSVNTSSGGVYLVQPAAATQYLAIRQKASPAVPYTITVKVVPNLHPTINLGAGVLIGDGTKQHTFGIVYGTGTVPNIVAEKWNSPASWQSAYFSIGYSHMGWLYFWLRMQDNGISRICSISTDGLNFRVLQTVSRTDFVTGSQVGFYCKAQNGAEAAGLMLVSWHES